MSISRAELLRLLPQALRGFHWRTEGARIVAHSDAGGVCLHLSREGSRSLGILRLPVTWVEFEFHGIDPAGQAAFLRHFDRVYQRGGG